MLDDVKSRLPLMVALLITACMLTYFFRNILGTGTLFTHFFYIPIILACIWWRGQGLLVTIVLVLVLTFSHQLTAGYRLTTNDFLRIMMLFVVSVMTVALSKKLDDARSALSASEKQYRTVFENTGTAMGIIENDKTISLINREFENLSGFSKEEVEGKKSWPEFVDPSDRKRMEGFHRQRRQAKNGAPGTYEFKFVNRHKEIREIWLTIDIIPGTTQSVASFSDITEFKQITAEQRILEQRLADAMEKALSGFIPICANCKKIRDETEHWIQIESFIKARTHADFSHGICPDCQKATYSFLYP